jgi:hypothetical protein
MARQSASHQLDTVWKEEIVPNLVNISDARFGFVTAAMFKIRDIYGMTPGKLENNYFMDDDAASISRLLSWTAYTVKEAENSSET